MKYPIIGLLLFVLVNFSLKYQVTAQTTATLTTLHCFSASNPFNGTNRDGISPLGGMLLIGDTLYGEADLGGYNNYGTLFSINTNGNNFTNFHIFSAVSVNAALLALTNYDGGYPFGGLVAVGNTLYGSAGFAGYYGKGCIFSIDISGANFSPIYEFLGGDQGTFPYAGLLLSGNTFYETAASQGLGGGGSVFSVDLTGSNYTTLHYFSGGTSNINNDGYNPDSKLTLDGNTLYGNTTAGGTNNSGTLFSVTTDGVTFSNFYTFSTLSTNDYTNFDGSGPTGNMLLIGDTLYGSAHLGGTNSSGTLFSVKTNGAAFTVLHTFAARAGDYATNCDGASPQNGFTLSGGMLYGAALVGGLNGGGTLFRMNLDGSGFTVLHHFAQGDGNPVVNTDGYGPTSGLVVVGNNIYGTTVAGGPNGSGTIFRLTLSNGLPRLTISNLTSNNIRLTWPTDFPGFTLQSTTNLVSPAWTNVASSPVITNGVYTVTNSISGTKQFFRLVQ